MSNNILKKSGLEIAKLIHTGKTTSREIVELHIERCQKVNTSINAIVKDRYNQARKEADLADKKIKKAIKEKSKLPTYAGVPCSIKEAFALKGMPNAAGLVNRKHIISQENATTVSRYLKAGAIPLGVTNTSELCMWMESYNKLYGRSCNPYNVKRITGGSSGGEGAIIAAAGTPFGLGSDVGGSIRLPAFFNGIFGHKPTGGLIPSTGQYPIARGKAARYLTTGPMCKRAEDLMPLVRILAGKDNKDSSVISWEIGNEKKVPLKGRQVIVIKDMPAPLVRKLDAELSNSINSAASYLESQGAQVREVKLASFKKALDIWSMMLHDGNEVSFKSMLKDGRKINLTWQLLKALFGRSEFTFPGLILALTESLPDMAPKLIQRAVDNGLKLRDELTELIGQDGLLLMPPYTVPAPKHNAPFVRPTDWIYTAILNVMELPATQVPLGLDKNGLPLGVQVAAIHGNDHLTIATAVKLEKAFGGWVLPEAL